MLNKVKSRLTTSGTKKYFRKILIAVLFPLIVSNAEAQNVQLLAEDFETPNFSFFSLNTAGPSGASGVNRWIINNEYNGQSVYPNTISEDSTNGGQIGGAPYSHYLHVYDSAYGASQNVFNCNYDAAQPSDNFVEMTNSVCARGLTNVTLAFFYTCTGSPSAYGTLWYSVNNGPWIQTGAAQYNTMNRWQYVTVTNPAFDNIANLKFGFRWQNNAGTPPSATAFGIDDIELVGTFNPANITLTVDSVSPGTVCPNSYVFAYWHLSAPLCDATYMYELSDFAGNFAVPTSLGVMNINNGQVSGANAVFIPAGTFPGSCYKIRLRRMNPAPLFTGNPSPCFTVQFCQNTITTLGTPVSAMDSNAVCAGSVIDVNFYSTGTYIFNSYQLQLSDANGNFVPPFDPNAIIIGNMPPPNGNVTYDPMNPTPGYPPPGMIEGLIPDTVSLGCNYRLRVIATSPATGPSPVIGTDWGPFCIQHCDIITNNEQDISICLYPADSICVALYINVNFYDSNAVYQPGNQFKVQLVSRGPIPPPFTQVGLLGALGTFTATNDTTVQLCISYAHLAQTGIPPGKYYMRIVATNSSIGADSSFSSLIRLTIGAPSLTPPTINAVDWNTFQPVDTVCTGDLVYFYLTPPPNSNSVYYWYSQQLQGSPTMQSVLLVNFASFSGSFIVYVRENSFGCLGPASPVDTIYVSGLPDAVISPPAVVCVGDTIQYTVPFASNTYWTWSLSPGIGTIVDSTGNQVEVVFNSAGYDTLFCQALNSCGLRLGFRRILVRDYPLIAALTDTAICSGSPVWLTATSGTGYIYTWRNGTTVIGNNNSITVSPTSTTIYTLSVSNMGFCYSYDTVEVSMYPFPPVPTITQNGDSLICSVTSGVTYEWYLNGIPQTQTTQYIIITPADSGSWYVVVTAVDSPFCSATSAALQIPVGITEVINQDYLSISPNPVAGELSIVNYLLSRKAEINIYNTLGEKILSKEMEGGEIKLDVNNLVEGIYVVRVIGEKINWAGKFVKQ